MADEDEKKHCFICETTSDERVLLPCEQDGEAKWVCVACLPPLIHGAY